MVAEDGDTRRDGEVGVAPARRRARQPPAEAPGRTETVRATQRGPEGRPRRRVQRGVGVEEPEGQPGGSRGPAGAQRRRRAVGVQRVRRRREDEKPEQDEEEAEEDKEPEAPEVREPAGLYDAEAPPAPTPARRHAVAPAAPGRPRPPGHAPDEQPEHAVVAEAEARPRVVGVVRRAVGLGVETAAPAAADDGVSRRRRRRPGPRGARRRPRRVALGGAAPAAWRERREVEGRRRGGQAERAQAARGVGGPERQPGAVDGFAEGLEAVGVAETQRVGAGTGGGRLEVGGEVEAADSVLPRSLLLPFRQVSTTSCGER